MSCAHTFGEYCHECRPKDHVMIPTALTPEERDALRYLAHKRVVIEIGSLLGASTVAMAEVAERVYAIDPHVGYPVANPRPTLENFLYNIDAHGLRNKVVAIIARGQDVLPAFAPKDIGLVFIDTMGDYRGTRDLLTLSARLLPWNIAVHDYGRVDTWDCRGVQEAVDEFANRANWFHSKTIGTLALLDRRP